jgi:hypothetical protein
MPMGRNINCFVLGIIGVLAPRGSSPTARMLATMLSGELSYGGLRSILVVFLPSV